MKTTDMVLLIVISSSFVTSQVTMASANTTRTMQDCFANMISVLTFTNVLLVEPIDLMNKDVRQHIIDVCEFWKSQTGTYVLTNETVNYNIPKEEWDKFNATHPIPEPLKRFNALSLDSLSLN